MRFLSIAVFLIATISLTQATGKNYAVLLAGSSGYGNYRHQADVYHVYQICKNHGIPEENIITLAYNDLAHHYKNPFPGQVFNHNTGSEPGVDVYQGVKIDYEDDDVNVDNYLAVLKGNSTGIKGGNGRVLQSGPQDNVFLFYSDHGAPGYVGMPAGKELYADQLISTIQWMFDNNRYNRLVYVLNACHSGSMLSSLPENINAFAINAANKDQSGWGTFCPPHDKVDGKNLKTCLSSQFPAAFTVNSDITNTKLETFELQFQLIKKAVTLSEAQQWGDKTWAQSAHISQLIGGLNQESKPVQNPNLFFPRGVVGQANEEFLKEAAEGTMEQRLIELQLLMQEYQETNSEEIFQELTNYIEQSKMFSKAVEQFAQKHGLSGQIDDTTNYECYRGMLNDFREQCGKFNDFSMHLSKYFYHYCNVKDYQPHQHLCQQQIKY